jgi:hypothetical protein
MGIPVTILVGGLLTLALVGAVVAVRLPWRRGGLAMRGTHRRRAPYRVGYPTRFTGRRDNALRDELRGLSKTEAEALLDWLESHGLADFEVRYDTERGFIIRRPAGK